MGIFNTRNENDAEAGGECGRQEARYRETHLFTGPIYDGAGNIISALSGPEFERARQAAKNGEQYIPPTNEEDEDEGADEDDGESEDSSPKDYSSHGGGGSSSNNGPVIPKNDGCRDILGGCLAIVLLLGGMVTGAFYGVTSCTNYVQKWSKELSARKSEKPTYEMWDQVIEMEKQQKLWQQQRDQRIITNREEPIGRYVNPPQETFKNQNLERKVADIPATKPPITPREMPEEIIVRTSVYNRQQYSEYLKGLGMENPKETTLLIEDGEETRRLIRFYSKSGELLKISGRGLAGKNGQNALMTVDLSNNGKYSSSDNGKNWPLVRH